MRLAQVQPRMVGWPQRHGNAALGPAVGAVALPRDAAHSALRSKPKLSSTIMRTRLLPARGSLRYSEWLGSGTRNATSTGGWTCTRPSAGLADACNGGGDGHCFCGVLAS